MNTSLSERYIAATINELPAQMHTDVRAELEASIADAISARMDHGEDRATAEHAVLTEMGDPAVLAAGYAERPLQLIGPRYYLTWWRLLRRLLFIVPPIVLGISAFAQILAGATIGEVIAEAIIATISTILHLCFWVTLAFAVIERNGGDLGIRWTVKDLPVPQEHRRGKSDLIASLVFLAIMLAVLVWDQTHTFIRVDQDAISVLNSELWPWAMAGLIALILLEAVFAIVLYARGGWSVSMAILNTVLNIAVFSWFVTLLVQGELFSPEFVNLAVLNGLNQEVRSILGIIFGFAVAAICLGDSIDGVVKTRKAQRVQVNKM